MSINEQGWDRQYGHETPLTHTHRHSHYKLIVSMCPNQFALSGVAADVPAKRKHNINIL